MRFEITNTNGGVWIYDNQTNHIESLSGQPSNIDSCKEYFKYTGDKTAVEPFSRNEDSKHKKSKDIKKLRIQLGLNCNYKCSFCLQASDKTLKTPAVVGDGIDRFFEMMDDAGIVVRPDAKIELWGGEPLVYWKTIKQFAPMLRERYPDCTLSTVSNGTLMNENILSFFLDNKIDITFSHDAQAYFLRGADPLDDPKMRSMWLKTHEEYKKNNLSFGINTVISQYNANLFDIQKFFEERLSKEIGFGFEGVVIAHTPNAIPFTKFPKREAELLRQSIFKAIVFDQESNVGRALHRRANGLIARIVNKVPANTIGGRCDVMNPHVLGVDMYGSVLTCHNVDPTEQSVGHLNDYQHINLNKFDHWSVRKKCPSCLVLNGCQGNCMRNNEFFHNASCDVEYMFHGFIFEAVWFLLTGSEIATVREVD